ncbi:Rad52/Rad22 family DNA repair protein [Rhodococcus sp. IEGM1300]
MTTNMTNEEKRSLQQRLKDAVSREHAKKKKGLGGKQVSYLKSETVTQVLNEIVPGGWSFEVVERFREEMYIKPNKEVNQFEFGGYTYHVHGRLTIDGLGSRDQFGAKPAVGNKDSDSNGYKAASSSAMVKCAAMFDIGRDIYTPENEKYQETQPQMESQWQQEPQQTYNNVVQMPQQQYDTYAQQGFPQQQMQGYIDPNQYQQPQQQMNYYVDPNTQPQPQQDMNYGHTQQQVPFPEQAPFNQAPQGFPMPAQEVAPPATPEQRDALPEAFWNPADNLLHSQTQAPVDLPFENVPAPQQESKGVFDEKYISKEAPNLIQEFTHHRQRLGLMDDVSLNPVLRDHFKDANAGIHSVTNETIGALVEYLRTIEAIAG